MVKKGSNGRDNELLIKDLFDQIEFLKQELTSKDTIIKLIDENYRRTADCNSQIVKKLRNMQTTLIKMKMNL